MGSLGTRVGGVWIYLCTEFTLCTETSNLVIWRRSTEVTEVEVLKHFLLIICWGLQKAAQTFIFKRYHLKVKCEGLKRQAQMKIVLRLLPFWVGGHDALYCCWTSLCPEGCLRTNGHMAGKFACQWTLVIPHGLFLYCKAPTDGSMNLLSGYLPTNPFHPLASRGTLVLGLEKRLAKDLGMGFRYCTPFHTHYPMSCFQVPSGKAKAGNKVLG